MRLYHYDPEPTIWKTARLCHKTEGMVFSPSFAFLHGNFQLGNFTSVFILYECARRQIPLMPSTILPIESVVNLLVLSAAARHQTSVTLCKPDSPEGPDQPP